MAADVEMMQAALVDAGAIVVTFTMPDINSVVPLARLVRGRLEAINDGIRRALARTGAHLLDLAAHPIASDPRVWSEDRIHANAAGHERIARALEATLDLQGFDWAASLPPGNRAGLRAAAAAELAGWRGHFASWVLRQLRGRSSGDGLTAKLRRR